MADPALSAASTALPFLVTAMQLTPGTIQTIVTSNVPTVDLPQATQSVSGSAGGVQMLRTAEQQLHYTLAQPQTAHMALPCTAVPYMAMQATAMQADSMQFTAMPSMVSPSVMTARPNQLGFVSAALNRAGVI